MPRARPGSKPAGRYRKRSFEIETDVEIEFDKLHGEEGEDALLDKEGKPPIRDTFNWVMRLGMARAREIRARKKRRKAEKSKE